MATDLSGVILPHLKRITLGGSNVLTEVNLPDAASTVSVRFITNAGKLAVSAQTPGRSAATTARSTRTPGARCSGGGEHLRVPSSQASTSLRLPARQW